MKVLLLSMYDSVCVKIRFQVMEVTSYILMLLTIFDFVEKFMEENCVLKKTDLLCPVRNTTFSFPTVAQ